MLNYARQIEDDSLDADMDFLDLTSKDVQSSSNTNAVQNFDSFNEDDDIVENSQETSLQKSTHDSLKKELAPRKPSTQEIVQHGLLMKTNVLNHRAEKDNKIEFYQERLAKLRNDRKTRCHIRYF